MKMNADDMWLSNELGVTPVILSIGDTVQVPDGRFGRIDLCHEETDQVYVLGDWYRVSQVVKASLTDRGRVRL